MNALLLAVAIAGISVTIILTVRSILKEHAELGDKLPEDYYEKLRQRYTDMQYGFITILILSLVWATI